MTQKPWIFVVSHVWPVPGVSGQEKRVYYMLKALRLAYNVSFLTYADQKKRDKHENELKELCDECIVLPSRYSANTLSRFMFKALGELFARLTGLKLSNFVIGHVELTRSRVSRAMTNRAYDAVVFEYWHAHKAADKSLFNGAPIILDMHNILWQTYKSQNVESNNRSPWALQRYKKFEEAIWKKFDYLIAINRDELAYVKSHLGNKNVWYIPMGTDLSKWPMLTDHANIYPRVAYYGGLASAHNQSDALRVYNEVMPEIWKKIPKAEFWIIGSKPPENIVALTKEDERVTVTGFIDEVAPVLGQIDLVLCPWEGTYGFRSRLIEVMATGIPVLTTSDATKGMDLDHGKGILLNDNLSEWSAIAIDLLTTPGKAAVFGKSARTEVESKYSLKATYDHLPEMIHSIRR